MSEKTAKEKLDEADKLYKEKKFKAAFDLYRKAAEQGDADAQLQLGIMYAKVGVEQSDLEAEKWYRKAARQGSAPAQYSLGVRYIDGVGVKKNIHEAAKWFRLAAEQGDIVAKYELDEIEENND